MKTNFYSFLSVRPLKFLVVAFALLCGMMVNAQTFTIWDPGTIAPPGGVSGAAANNDDLTGTGVTTGIKFRVTDAGTVSAIRYYQGDQNIGTHTGTLWLRNPDNSNTILDQVVFTGETLDGWQEMAFPVPISLLPGRIYTATIHSSSGVYSAENNVLPASFDDASNPPFIIMAGDGSTDPTALGNGAYVYENDPDVYPTNPVGSGYFRANYFVDVVFTTTFLLPVTLTNFNAVDKNYDVNLSWETQMEQNNAGFEVQRSVNGSDYSAISFVDGAGESSSKKTYAYTDRNLEPGLYYYRLKQLDRDGTVKFSPVVTATISRRSHIVLYQNFPNPVRNKTTIQYVLPSTMHVNLTLVDINGRTVKVLDNGNRQAGQHSIDLDASTLMKGTYFYRLETDAQPMEVRSLVVQ